MTLADLPYVWKLRPEERQDLARRLTELQNRASVLQPPASPADLTATARSERARVSTAGAAQGAQEGNLR